MSLQKKLPYWALLWFTSDQYKSYITVQYVNLLTPNVNYSGRTAPLTSKVVFYIFIQQI